MDSFPESCYYSFRADFIDIIIIFFMGIPQDFCNQESECVCANINSSKGFIFHDEIINQRESFLLLSLMFIHKKLLKYPIKYFRSMLLTTGILIFFYNSLLVF